MTLENGLGPSVPTWPVHTDRECVGGRGRKYITLLLLRFAFFVFCVLTSVRTGVLSFEDAPSRSRGPGRSSSSLLCVLEPFANWFGDDQHTLWTEIASAIQVW